MTFAYKTAAAIDIRVEAPSRIWEWRLPIQQVAGPEARLLVGRVVSACGMATAAMAVGDGT